MFSRTILVVSVLWLMLLITGASAQTVSTPESPERRIPNSSKEINRQPLYDFADMVLERVESKKLALSKTFELGFSGKFDQYGILDPAFSVFTKIEGDTELIEIAKSAIEAYGATGVFKYLSNAGFTEVEILLGQNESNVYGTITSESEDENAAKRSVTALRSLVAVALIAHKKGIRTLREDDVALLNSLKITQEDKKVVVSSNLEKETGLKIVERLLELHKGFRERQNAAESN